MGHRWQGISPIAVLVIVRWSVCLSRSCTVLKRQTRFDFFCINTTAQCWSLQDRIIIWFTSFNIFPNFAPKWANPCYLSVGDIQWQIAVEWLETAQWSQWRAYRKPPSLFRMVRSMTPYDLPFPKTGVEMWQISSAYEHVAFCQISLAIVSIVHQPVFIDRPSVFHDKLRYCVKTAKLIHESLSSFSFSQN